MTAKVGFIGLGRMGLPMASNLIAAGFDVVVYDLRREPQDKLARLGAAVARSPEEIAGSAETIELAVVDDLQVKEVMLGAGGLLATARPGSIMAIHSTINPKTMIELGQLAEKKGIQILDAQVSGGELGAQQKQLCYMVGGAKEAVEKCRPLFSTSGSNIFHLGGLGSGATAKMILQVVVCINMLAAGEAEHLCEASGVEFSALQQLISVSSAQSFVFDHWIDRFKCPDDPMAIRQRRTDVFRKSLFPALELAKDNSLTLPGAALALERLGWAMGIETR